MSYRLHIWKDPKRKRLTSISYTDPEYTKYYDLDLNDFTSIVVKVRNKQRLTNNEELRYTDYLYTIMNIVLENPKFKNKPVIEKEELQEQAIMELLQALPSFDPNKGSSLYSYAYRCCYTAYCHYYTNKIKDYNKKKAIEEHCMSELNEYLEFIGTGKVNNVDVEDCGTVEV